METSLCCGVVSPVSLGFLSMVYAAALVVSDGFKGKLDMLIGERCSILTA